MFDKDKAEQEALRGCKSPPAELYHLLKPILMCLTSFFQFYLQRLDVILRPEGRAPSERCDFIAGPALHFCPQLKDSVPQRRGEVQIFKAGICSF